MQNIDGFWGFKKREVEICNGKETHALVLNYIIALLKSSQHQDINKFDNKYYARLSYSRIAKRFHWMGTEKIRHILRYLIKCNVLVKKHEMIRGTEYVNNYYTLSNDLYKEYTNSDELNTCIEFDQGGVESDLPNGESDRGGMSNPTPYNKNTLNKKRKKKEEYICQHDPILNDITAQKVMDLWNSIVDEKGTLSNIKELNANRHELIKELSITRLPTIDDWRTYFYSIYQSKFLLGQANGTWKANFEWVLNSSNALKIIEGQYFDKQKKMESNSEIENFRRNILGLGNKKGVI